MRTYQAGCRPTRMLFVPALLALTACGVQTSIFADELGLRVAEGFQVTLYADDDLAHDIHSMTVDALGRVVVSGAGYVKILIDSDRDGRADTAHTYVDGPATGAQGLFFHGRDLLCAGDGGLLRYRDANGDDRADGPPDVFLKIRAGEEHDLHAIRRGPDGWWYAIAGNMAGVTATYNTLPGAPVRDPQGGVILRLKPDLSQGEVYAHGFRNAYDFDFTASGELFSFDSDDEPEISLPWYRETRVFHILPGSHQGWISHGWKRPENFFDMSPVVARFGRSSPTGVAAYRHTAFPAAYRDAVFIADWTFGRVFALPLTADGATWTSQPIEFLSAEGQHGFAPTDIEIGPQGEMYVCIGGRGTRGGVYKITPINPGAAVPVPAATASGTELLDYCLRAPQPLSSWSRRTWEPLVAKLNEELFLKAAIDRRRSDAERVRAIEILTEKFNGLNGDLLMYLASDSSPQVRARAAWSVGRTNAEQPNPRFVGPLLLDPDSQVQRNALEALFRANNDTLNSLAEPLGQVLGNPDRVVRQTAMRVLTNAEDLTLRNIAELGYKYGWRAAIPVAGAYALRGQTYAPYSVEIALRMLQGNQTPALKLEAARILQIGLGDVAPASGMLPAVFDGYAPRISLTGREQDLERIKTALARVYPTRLPEVDYELERVLAMVQPADPQLFSAVLGNISPSSSPVDDVHRLIVLSRMSVAPAAEQREVIAATLVRLELKVRQQSLRQDSNWSERVRELYEALSKRDPALPTAVLNRPEFGLPGHVILVSRMGGPQLDAAINAFARRIQSEPGYEWNADVAMLLGESRDPVHRELLRQKYQDFALRDTVLITLAQKPQAEDRAYLVDGLLHSHLDILEVCVRGLALLPPSPAAYENAVLARSLRKLGDSSEEQVAIAQIIELLRRNLGEDHGYVLGDAASRQQAAINAWIAAVQQKFPAEFARALGGTQDNADQIRQGLAQVNWQNGDAAHGAELFKSRSCAQCHGGQTALGPDLTGVTNRFSRDDLFTAILAPDQDVSPRYQTIQIATTGGQVYTGLIVYETAEGIVLRDAANRTYRIEQHEIDVRKSVPQSIMPSGLLRDLKPQDYADLYAYLRSLSQPNTAGSPAQVPAR